MCFVRKMCLLQNMFVPAIGGDGRQYQMLARRVLTELKLWQSRNLWLPTFVYVHPTAIVHLQKLHLILFFPIIWFCMVIFSQRFHHPHSDHLQYFVFSASLMLFRLAAYSVTWCATASTNLSCPFDFFCQLSSSYTTSFLMRAADNSFSFRCWDNITCEEQMTNLSWPHVVVNLNACELDRYIGAFFNRVLPIHQNKSQQSAKQKVSFVDYCNATWYRKAFPRRTCPWGPLWSFACTLYDAQWVTEILQGK